LVPLSGRQLTYQFHMWPSCSASPGYPRRPTFVDEVCDGLLVPTSRCWQRQSEAVMLGMPRVEASPPNSATGGWTESGRDRRAGGH
jgi:hypothetical protein